MVDSPNVTQSYATEDTFIGLDNKRSSDNIELPKQKENNGSCTLRMSDFVKDCHDMDVDKSSTFESPNKEKCQYIANTVQVGEDQEKNNPYYSNGSTRAVKV